MNEIPRRSALLAGSMALSAALLSGRRATADDSPTKGTRQWFTVGPVPLRELIPPAEKRVRDSTRLPLDEILKAVGAMDLFVIDERVYDGRAWKLAETEEGVRPRLAIAGKLGQVVTDDARKEFAVAVKQVEATGIDTYHAAPEWRAFHVALKIAIWNSDRERLEASELSALHDTGLAYNVAGVRLLKTTDGKWKPAEPAR